MDIQAVVASTFKDETNGWSYSEAALADLAESAQGKPVIFNKRRVGIVRSGKCENGRVTVTATISEPEGISNKAFYLVPGGLTDFDTAGDMINTCAAHQFFFTSEPSDKTLSTFVVVE